jgi:O-antigen ligase
MSYYLTFFIVTNLVRERRQLNFLLNGVFLIATIVATAMSVQFVLGNSVQLLPGRVETLWTQGVAYEDITRILPPGWSIVLVSFVAFICTLTLEKSKPLGWLKFLQCGFMGMALLLTFLRSYWAALILVLFLLVYFLRGRERKRFIGWALVIIVSAAMILMVVSSDSGSRAARLVSASIDRLSTLGNSGTFQGQDSSLNWRMLEVKYAVASIASHPVIGLGMGASYRPYDPRLDVPGSNYDFTKHIHNGHLWILLDTGLLGYLSLIWLSLVFLIRGFRYWRNVPDARMRGIVLGFTLVYVVVLIAAVANSTFVMWNWIPVIGIMLGANEALFREVPHVPTPT